MSNSPTGEQTQAGGTAATATTLATPPGGVDEGRTKNQSPKRGTLYRGQEGMWSWVGHRVTGVVIFFFLLVHVLDTSLVRVSPEAYDAVINLYKTPFMAAGEAGLVGAIVFHALNGIRIILVDFWSKGTRYQRQLLWGVIIGWFVLMVPFMIRHVQLAIQFFDFTGGGH